MKKLQTLAMILGMGLSGCQEKVDVSSKPTVEESDKSAYSLSEKVGFQYDVEGDGGDYSFKITGSGSEITSSLLISTGRSDGLRLYVLSIDSNNDGKLDYVYYSDQVLGLDVFIHGRLENNSRIVNGNMNPKEVETIYRRASKRYLDFKKNHGIEEKISAYNPSELMRVKEF
ncbi:MAG: hypothetical protein Q8Q01_05260 [archaeon]|nr:hypothetical protein [archaeon]